MPRRRGSAFAGSNGAAPGVRAPAEFDTSANPYSRARPLLSLLRRPLNLVLAVVAVGWIFPAADFRVFSITSGLLIAVLALGIMVMTGWVREINLASAGVFATALYLGSWVYRPGPNGWGAPLLVAVVVAAVIGIAMMLAVAIFSVRLSGVYVMVFTLGVQILVERIVFNQYTITGGNVRLSTPNPELLGVEIDRADDRVMYLFVLSVLAVVLAFLWRLRCSPYGRAMMLVGADQQAAAAVGIRPLKTKATAFAICGALAGLAGMLASTLYGSAPGTINYTATTSLLWLSIAILGGFDSMLGVVTAALVLHYLPLHLERFHISYQLLAGLSLMAGVLCGSRGLGGRGQDIYRRLRFGSAATRRARRPSSFAARAEVLARADGLTELRELGPGDAVRAHALRTLETWFPPRRTEPIALAAEGVTLAFGGVHALRGASLEVPTGSLTGLIGPNGAGKTTLFNVVSGLARPDSGTVRIFGEDVTGVKPWERAARGMTRTFQSTRVIGELGVGDNLLAGAGLRISGNLTQFALGMPAQWRQVREAEEAAWAIACLLDIERYWDERVGELEFSARRRTELGRALMAGPQILLLDEPTSGLDPASSGALISLVRRLQADLGLTVLLVEHYVKAVLDSADLVYVLTSGQMLAHGDPATVAGDPDVQRSYLGFARGPQSVNWRDRQVGTPGGETQKRAAGV